MKRLGRWIARVFGFATDSELASSITVGEAIFNKRLSEEHTRCVTWQEEHWVHIHRGEPGGDGLTKYVDNMRNELTQAKLEWQDAWGRAGIGTKLDLVSARLADLEYARRPKKKKARARHR